MKKIIKSMVIAISFMLILGICNVSLAAVSMNVTSNKSTVEPGENFSVTISIKGGAGYVNISATNGTVDKSYEWIEDSSITVNCVAGNSGTTTINVSGTIADSETAEDTPVTGNATVSIKENTTPENPSTPEVPTTPETPSTPAEPTTPTTEKKSTEARLKDFGIKPKEYDFSGFKSNTYEYTAKEVPNDVTEVEVYATPKDSNAKVTGTGKVSLKEGENTIKVEETAEEGTTKKT